MDNKTLLGSVEALRELSKREMAPKISWKVAKVLISVEDSLKPFEVARVGIVKKYADDAGVVSDVPGFNSAMEELLGIELEFSFDKLKLDDLGEEKLSPGLLASLVWLIEE